MHNGGVANFYKFKGKFLRAMSDKILCEIKVNIDIIFCLLFTYNLLL